MKRSLVILSAAGLIALGSVATYFLMRRDGAPSGPAVQSTGPAPSPVASSAQGSVSGTLPDIAVTLTKEAVARAGIIVSHVVASHGAAGIRVPAVVEPNEYRSVVVTSIAAGRITSVSAELGQPVKRGQTLAQVYSPELAEAQSGYLASRAELEAHDRELRRTERLVELGSASRQELERIHAEHTAALAMVGSQRSQLTLLGMTAVQIEKLSPASPVTATFAVAAPIDGAVTARTANVGLNVDSATQLFTIIDLSTVWLVGDVYERDLGRVRVGAPVTATVPAYPELVLQGKVSYIDPEIKAETRTARIRVEMPNPGRQLRFGMYAQVAIDQSPKSEVQNPESKVQSPPSRLTVPREAVQTIGDRSVVYLADPAADGRFIEHEVKLGAAAGTAIEVTDGLQQGDSIVVKGSFSLRAERERLGLRASAAETQPAPVATPSTRITVSDKGFEPARVTGRAGVLLRLTFVRTSDATCATEVTIPSLNITRALPLNQPVDLEITPQRNGDVEFACGMDMFRGTIVVQ